MSKRWNASAETHHATWRPMRDARIAGDRKSTRLNSSHANISYAVFCLKKKKNTTLTLSFSSPTPLFCYNLSPYFSHIHIQLFPPFSSLLSFSSPVFHPHDT